MCRNHWTPSLNWNFARPSKFRIFLMGSSADGMLWPPWLTWWSVRFVGVRSRVRFRKRLSCVGQGNDTHAVHVRFGAMRTTHGASRAAVG